MTAWLLAYAAAGAVAAVVHFRFGRHVPSPWWETAWEFVLIVLLWWLLALLAKPGFFRARESDEP